MDLYPAIDLRDGQVVRLYQGDYDQQTVYHDDPVEQAQQFAAAGAPWLHVVDLDAARSGRAANRSAIAAIAAAVDVPVQCGGGVRDESAARALFEAGIARVVIGTAALEQPALVHQLAAEHSVAVGLDERGGEIVVRGWERSSERTALDLVLEFEDAGVEAFVVTEVGRDGTLEGPDLDGLGAVLAATTVPVIASGGVGSVEDVQALRRLERGERRLAGAIVGRAIYEGRVDVAEAVRVLASDS